MDYDELSAQREQLIMEELWERRMISEPEFFYNWVYDNLTIKPRKGKKRVDMNDILEAFKYYCTTYGYSLEEFLDELKNYN